MQDPIALGSQSQGFLNQVPTSFFYVVRCGEMASLGLASWLSRFVLGRWPKHTAFKMGSFTRFLFRNLT